MEESERNMLITYRLEQAYEQIAHVDHFKFNTTRAKLI